MEAARTSEMSVDNYFTRQYIPEDIWTSYSPPWELEISHFKRVRSPTDSLLNRFVRPSLVLYIYNNSRIADWTVVKFDEFLLKCVHTL
jgi:hypothetical protein